jgi:hypothetical protein
MGSSQKIAKNGTPDAKLLLINTPTNGVITVEKANSLGGPWEPEASVFSVGPTTEVKVALSGPMTFFRVKATGQTGFTNLVEPFLIK